MTFLISLLLASPAQMSGEELLQKTIAFHDPKGDFLQGRYRFEIQGEYANGQVVPRVAEVDYRDGTLLDRYERKGHTVEARVEGDRCELRADGSASIPDEVVKELRLTCERAQMYRNYLSYLWGLPMKLRDSGTRVDPVAIQGTFEGREVWELGVSYDPEVGTDRWTFFIDRESFAMIGYAFVQADGDGEVIPLEGMVELSNGVRLPKKRTWYVTKGRKLLGVDTLVSATRVR